VNVELLMPPNVTCATSGLQRAAAGKNGNREADDIIVNENPEEQDIEDILLNHNNLSAVFKGTGVING
jgi:hypothetical protein